MRILVLGFTGYLGTHVVEGLRALPGALVLGGGRAPTADHRIDLATVGRDQLAKTLAAVAPDTVINCAGATGGDPVTLAEVNARGPAVLCAALREATPGARLVHLGSAAEYGPGVPDVRVTESAATRPLAPYGATKLAGTIAVTTSGLDAVVLRVGNPVGPGAPSTGLPGRIAGLLRAAGPDPDAVLPLGDLSAHRDFVDVRDVARAAVLAATAPGPLPPVLNIGGGRAVPVREVVRGLADKAGFRGRIAENAAGSGGAVGRTGPAGAAGAGGAAGAAGSARVVGGAASADAAHAAGGAGPTGSAQAFASVRSADVSWQCSDITAAEAALGWRPTHTLDDALTALWESGERGGGGEGGDGRERGGGRLGGGGRKGDGGS
ncbi:NAD-dependent epimerase/dehydratase family protein [Streptomyces sp. CA-210063]|uniref:NAD-dependent epimerase/dehydratase family protein n=1 Tax=Streptomyces sp. CA-210063 TaxID=2801029 RepID=UPI00214AD8D5|nr:NAD-dependent epimerase/dehydratase family protein [Streptomyces sp. CA-210063]UUU36074.1 NAD-dependent epimerase/dehydratase family protein [Streptomyces sp. CA-210063]